MNISHGSDKFDGRVNVNLSDLQKKVVKIKMCESKTSILNYDAWREALGSTLDSRNEMGRFLQPESGIEVQRENLAKMSAHLSAARLTRAKGSGNKVKSESGEDEVKLPRAEIIQRNAAKLAKESGNESEANAEVLVDVRPVFVEYLTHVTSESEISHDALEPCAEVEYKGHKLWCEVEGAGAKADRMVAWEIAVSSMGEMPKSRYSHVSVGNVYALVNFVSKQYLKDGKRFKVEKVAGIMEEMFYAKKESDELFATFDGRMQTLYDELGRLCRPNPLSKVLWKEVVNGNR